MFDRHRSEQLVHLREHQALQAAQRCALVRRDHIQHGGFFAQRAEVDPALAGEHFRQVRAAGEGAHVAVQRGEDAAAGAARRGDHGQHAGVAHRVFRHRLGKAEQIAVLIHRDLCAQTEDAFDRDVLFHRPENIAQRLEQRHGVVAPEGIVAACIFGAQQSGDVVDLRAGGVFLSVRMQIVGDGEGIPAIGKRGIAEIDHADAVAARPGLVRRDNAQIALHIENHHRAPGGGDRAEHARQQHAAGFAAAGAADDQCVAAFVAAVKVHHAAVAEKGNAAEGRAAEGILPAEPFEELCVGGPAGAAGHLAQIAFEIQSSLLLSRAFMSKPIRRPCFFSGL